MQHASGKKELVKKVLSIPFISIAGLVLDPMRTQ
jgi:hypothetical protein